MSTFRMVALGTLIKPAKIKKCGSDSYPVLSMTMHDGLVFQSEKFKKTVASKDTSEYKVVYRNQLVISFPIDEGVLAAQRIVDAGIVSPAYGIWDIDEEQVIPEFLEHSLRCKRALEYYKAKLRGSTARRRSLPTPTLLAFRVPLPSLQTQETILEIINKSREILNDRQSQLTELDALIKARFVEMFGDPATNPLKWKQMTFKEASVRLSDGPFGSNLKSEHYSDSGVRVIRLGNIGVGQFIDTDKTYIPFKHYEKLKKYTCTAGEIVVGTLGEPNLRACIIPKHIGYAVNKADCVHYIPKPEILNVQFVCQYINCPELLLLATGMVHGQTRSRISSGQLAKMPLFIPPIELQNQFAAFVEVTDKSKVACALSDDSLKKLYTVRRFF